MAGIQYKLMRWQPDYTVGVANAAASDAGTVIPSWVYSTGFEVYGSNAIPERMLMDSTGAVQVFVEKTATDNESSRKVEFTQGESDRPIAPDIKSHKYRLRFTGARAVTMRRAMLKRRAIETEGG